MPTETTAKTASEAVKTGAETVKTASEKVKATTDQYTAAGASAFKGGVEKSLAGLNEMNAQSKRNLEAVVASATAAAKGAEVLGTQTMAYSKSAMERHVEATKALTSARSFQEAVELQSAYAKSAMETYLAEMTRATETLSATMKDTLRPLNERATSVMETMQIAR
jgi:phasin family protein